MADPAQAALEDEFEDVGDDGDEYDEGELIEDEDEDGEYAPGEEDEEETEGLDAEDAPSAELDELSDTNAPYAEGEQQQEGAGAGAGAAGSSSGGFRFVNPLQLLQKLRPRELVAAARGQRKRLQRLVWRLEDASVFTAKFARKAAVRGARPALVWLIAARALRTLDRADDVGVRMLRKPASEQLDYYYRSLLGDDWEQQMQRDFADALAEVDEGLVTDDYVRDRKGLQAAIMRRLEVEEWDKERMRHFYYGLYGLGPWYWDMEERLHNPFFVGARGWNGPPESWIGENETFMGDMDPRRVDFRADVAGALGDLRGRPLSAAATKRLMEKEAVGGADEALAGPMLRRIVNPAAAKAAMEARRRERRQQQQEAAAPA